MSGGSFDHDRIMAILQEEFGSSEYEYGCCYEDGYYWVLRTSGGQLGKIEVSELGRPMTEDSLIDWFYIRLGPQDDGS